MTTNLSANQPTEDSSMTDLSTQGSPVPESTISNELLNANEQFDEHTDDEHVSDDLLDDELLDDEDEHSDDEVSVAGQAVPVLIDVAHTVVEDEAGLRIDKVASKIFTDFSRVQLQGWITDGSLLYNGSAQNQKFVLKPVTCCI